PQDIHNSSQPCCRTSRVPKVLTNPNHRGRLVAHNPYQLVGLGHMAKDSRSLVRPKLGQMLPQIIEHLWGASDLYRMKILSIQSLAHKQSLRNLFDYSTGSNHDTPPKIPAQASDASVPITNFSLAAGCSRSS